MRHALGHARASWSRKGDLIMRIMIRRNIDGMSVPECRESVQGYSRKKVDELLAILKEVVSGK